MTALERRRAVDQFVLKALVVSLTVVMLDVLGRRTLLSEFRRDEHVQRLIVSELDVLPSSTSCGRRGNLLIRAPRLAHSSRRGSLQTA
jgi:hypothetical protein